MSESRQTYAQNTLADFENQAVAETFAGPHARREFILGLGPHDFKQWLVGINATARGLDRESHDYDGENVSTMFMMPPDQQDKDDLLGETLAAAKTILSDESHIEDKLQTVSLLFSGAINYIHPFADGNGRTSRIAGLLMWEGFDGSQRAQDRFKRLMESSGGIEAFQNTPSGLTKWLNAYVVRAMEPENAERWPIQMKPDNMAGEGLGEAAYGHLSEESRKKGEKAIRDGDFGDYVLTKVALERDLMPDGVEINDKGFAWVEPERILEKFKDEDIDYLAEMSRQARRERVRLFLKAMVTPEQFPIHIARDQDDIHFTDRDTTLKDYYYDLVVGYSRLFSEKNPIEVRDERRLGEMAVDGS